MWQIRGRFEVKIMPRRAKSPPTERNEKLPQAPMIQGKTRNPKRDAGLVRVTGVEPARRKHENLNLACLPISSCPHSNAILPQPRAGSKQKIAVRFLKAAETRKRRIFYFVLRLHNERETHGANPVSPAFLIRFRRAAALPRAASLFRRTSASRCRTRRGWSGAASG